MAKNQPTTKYVGSAGLNDKDDSYEIGFEALTEATNIEITRNRKPRRRAGSAQVLAATPSSALIRDEVFLYLEGSSLKRMNEDFSTDTIRTDMVGQGLAGAVLNGNVYYSDGIKTGVYSIENRTDRSLGLTVPGVAALSLISGQLRAGRYQAVLTYVRDDGQESGTSKSARIETTADDGGISFSLPTSSDPTVESVNIYMTYADGTEYYLAATVDNGTATYDFQGYSFENQRKLMTWRLAPPSGFTDISEFAGRLVYIKDQFITYSEPYAYELVDPRTGFINLTGKVTLFAPNDDGVFIGTNKRMWFARGDDMPGLDLKAIADYGAIEGTLAYAQGSVVGDGSISEDYVPIWMSSRGLCVGLPNGSVENATIRKVNTPSGGTGTAMVRERDGNHFYVSVIQS
ncbi:MAG: hypothetical protein GTN99_08070 [Candidatus Dadabacteria bacterium]|nr:hypothetical protein [Candidatus Dadabacteria bacterium]